MTSASWQPNPTHSPSSQAPTTALVTGANKGIGRETAERLAALGWTVWLGARDVERGKAAAADLSAGGGDVRFVQLDVTSDASVDAAAATISAESGSLDVLVNNVGVSGPRVPPADTTAADFLACFGVNLLGPVRVTYAFLPLLRRSADPRVVMVSSGMGSFGVTTDPTRLESTLHGLVYQSSKAALNMVTTQYARAVPEVRFNAVDPGYTATDLNGHNGIQSIAEGAVAVGASATSPADGPTGGFSDRFGAVAW
ncbi:MAG TPA: SDR family NAD(P)-dependent oxidoreductase [Actinopolymorphaceae bacterium]|jgi:NAD(P)-dependent dehydrogenase (short-subunit alcohol dehydrogenase family)